MTQGISDWVLADIKTDQANIEADLATRIIEALASEQPLDGLEQSAYDSALKAMTLYLTKSCEVKE